MSAANAHQGEGGMFSQLYDRAVNLFRAPASAEGEARPLLHGQNAESSEAPTQQQQQYGAVPSGNGVRVPKPRKVQSPVKVEAKVWFANERTWISWLRASVLMGTLSLGLFNSSSHFEPKPTNPDDPFEPGPYRPGDKYMAKTVKTFGMVYAWISVLTLLWALYSYQHRVTLIKRRWPGSFDDMIGPPAVCAAIFVAVLLNYIVAMKRHSAD